MGSNLKTDDNDVYYTHYASLKRQATCYSYQKLLQMGNTYPVLNTYLIKP